MLTRLGPPLVVAILVGPVVAGLAGTLLPAFGYLPALGGAQFSLAPLNALLAQPGIMMSTLVSLFTGLAAAALSLVFVMLFVAGWAGTRSFSRVQHLLSPLLSVPHAAAAFGLAFLIAPSGMIFRVLSPELTGWTRPPDLLIVNDPMGLSMIAGLVVKETPFLLLIALAALPQADVARTRALAASLGYGPVAGFLHGVWPPLYRQMRLAVFAVIAFSTSVVDVATILGPTTPAPLAVRLVDWMRDPDLSLRFMAAAGALLQLGVTAAAMLAWIAVEHAVAALRDRMLSTGRRFRRDLWLRRAALAVMVAVAATVFCGLATLGLWSVAGLWQFPDAIPDQLTLRNWMTAAPRIAAPLATTFIAAALSTSLATLLVLLCLMREDETGRRAGRRALGLVYLPLLVPQAAFLFGLQLILILSGAVASLPALVFVHLVFVLPYVFLSLSDPWRAFDRRYEAIAAGLGKSRWTIFVAIRLPMLTRAILTAAAVGFAVSIGLYLPTVLIGAGRLETITTEAVALCVGGQPPDHRRLCLPADGAARPRLSGRNPCAGADIPASPRLACVARRDMADKGLFLDRVAISLGARQLLSVEARVSPGEVFTVMGPSGSGKSTLLAFIGGFLDRAFTASGRVFCRWRRADRPARRRSPCRHPVSGPAALPAYVGRRKPALRHSARDPGQGGAQCAGRSGARRRRACRPGRARSRHFVGRPEGAGGARPNPPVEPAHAAARRALLQARRRIAPADARAGLCARPRHGAAGGAGHP